VLSAVVIAGAEDGGAIKVISGSDGHNQTEPGRRIQDLVVSAT
jgi:hypothetical protein